MVITSTQAWFPEDAQIRLENRVTGSVATITTEVTNFSDGGGDKTTESIAHFGGAFLVIKKPQEDFEVEFDVSVTDTTWMEIISGDVVKSGGFEMVRSGGPQRPHKVKIEWISPDNNEAYKILYYNAYGVSFTKDNAADDRLTGTISFTVSPTSALGSPQRLEMETSDRTNAAIGSSSTGSYGAYEVIYDTMYGYSVGSML